MSMTKHNEFVWMGLIAAVLTTRALSAQGTPAAAGNPAPAPLAVWADTPWQPLLADMKPPVNRSSSVKLASARGGIASGLVLVSGAGGPVTAKAEELRGPGGAIPVRLRYATRRRDLGPTSGFEIVGNPNKLDAGFDLGQTQHIDALSDSPVGDEPVQPVWVTVDVPATAQPGEYQGKVVVQGKTVQITLCVASFIVPPPGERRLYVNVHQSPDSVAFRYGVAPWSDQHFTLIEPSLALAGRVGANIMYVPVIGHTYFGQRNGLIVFSRKGNQLVPDFAAFDRYLDLWIKHCGKPRLVVLGIWDVHLAGNSFWNRNYLTKRYPVDPANPTELTVRGENGKLEQVSTPRYDKNLGLWKSVVEGVRQRIGKVGLAKHQILLGQCTDVQATKDVVEAWKAIDPDLRWTAWTHGYGYGGGSRPGPHGLNGNRMGLMAYPDLRTNPLQGPGRCVPVLPGPDTVIVLDAVRMYLRAGDQADIAWRLAPDVSADCREHGYGPVGLDLWAFPPFVPTAAEKAERKFSQGGRWTLKLDYGPNLDRGQPGSCTVAGPHGALSTTRLEGLAEGSCEAEARLCIELAIAAKKMDAAAAKPILVARYKGFNKEVTEKDRKTGAEKTVTVCDVSGATAVPADWSDSLAALYDLAAKAQSALDGK